MEANWRRLWPGCFLVPVPGETSRDDVVAVFCHPSCLSRDSPWCSDFWSLVEGGKRLDGSSATTKAFPICGKNLHNFKAWLDLYTFNSMTLPNEISYKTSLTFSRSGPSLASPTSILQVFPHGRREICPSTELRKGALLLEAYCEITVAL